MNIVLKPVEGIFGVLSDAKKQTGTMDAASKMLTNGWKAIEVGAEIAVPAMTNITKQFVAFQGLVGALNIVDRTAEWFSPTKRKDWTTQKYLSQGALTVSHGLEFANFLNQAGVVSLGSFASQVAPGIVPLEVVKNTFYIPASIFGIWHSAIAMRKQDDTVANLTAKIAKWSDRAQRGANADQNVVDGFRNEVVQKINSFNVRIADLNQKRTAGTITDKENAKFTKLETRLRHWTVYRDELNVGPSATLAADCNHKVDGYRANEAAANVNRGKAKTKEWLGIANNVGKLVMGIIGLVATFIGLFASTVFVASFAAGWFVTHTMNFAKGIYEERNKALTFQKPDLV